MTQFGRRVAAGSTVSPSQSYGEPSNVDAALAVVRAGKLPAWTTVGPTMLVLGLLLFGGGLYFITVTYAGEILRDLRLAGTWQVAYDLRAVSGSCKRYNFVVTSCSANIQSVAEPNRPAVKNEFMMLFSSGGGEQLVPVRSTTDRSAVGIAYATDTKLTNRTLTFIGLTGTLIAMLIGLVSALAKGRYNGGAAHRDLLDGIAELQARAESMQAFSRTTA